LSVPAVPDAAAAAAAGGVQFDMMLDSYKKHSKQWSATFNKFAEGECLLGMQCLQLLQLLLAGLWSVGP
jgi:hypothetical protein